MLADVLAVFGDDNGLHWQELAGRLAAQLSGRWADTSSDAVSAELRARGMPSVVVTAGGQRGRGCRRDAVETAARQQ